MSDQITIERLRWIVNGASGLGAGEGFLLAKELLAIQEAAGRGLEPVATVAQRDFGGEPGVFECAKRVIQREREIMAARQVALREALCELHDAITRNPAQTLWSESMRDALTVAAAALKEAAGE